jgi:hypothetical protein
MTKKHNGGPAFPCKILVNQSSDPLATRQPVRYTGMTLRDWFAGKALMSMLNTPTTIGEGDFARAAELSYRFADAMLAERDNAKA